MQNEDYVRDIGRSLARARARGELLEGTASFAFPDSMADAVQTAACQLIDDQQCGYSTLRMPRQSTSASDNLIVGPLFRDTLIDASCTFRLPQGVLGAQPALLLTMGRLYPHQEQISRATIESAIIACELGLVIVGQRFPGSAPLTVASATADFGLHVAQVRGPQVPDWRTQMASLKPVLFLIDRTLMDESSFAAIFDRALNDLVDLVTHLTHRGGHLNTGDVAAVGSRLPAFQVLPGQTLRVETPGLDAISVRLQ